MFPFTSLQEPISFLDPQNVQSVKENEDAFVKCMVTGDPEPTITWYYNGQPLNGNVYAHINLFPVHSFDWFPNTLPLFITYKHTHTHTVDSKKYQALADGLLIKNVLKSDSGEYTCKAFQISSALSNVEEKTIRLNIQRKKRKKFASKCN